MKKLFSENTSAGFPGNILTEDNFNDIIESLVMAENYAVTQSGNVLTFDNGIRVEMTDFDTDGDFTRVMIESTLTTARSPLYPNFDKTVYRNPEIINVDTSASFVVLTPAGVPVSASEFTLSPTGEFTFTTPQTESHFTVDGLSYILKNEITVSRDGTTKEITNFSINSI